MRPVVVVFLLPVVDGDPGVGQGPEQVDVEALVAESGVERLSKGFFQGSPGGMNSIPVRVPAHSTVAAAIISGPLSSCSTAGAQPRRPTSRFSSRARMSAVIERSTGPPRASRVCSSRIVRILIGRPSVVESN